MFFDNKEASRDRQSMGTVTQRCQRPTAARGMVSRPPGDGVRRGPGREQARGQRAARCAPDDGSSARRMGDRSPTRQRAAAAAELGCPLRGVPEMPRAGAYPERAPQHALRKVRRRVRSEEHTSELQSLTNLVCRLLLEKKK